MSSVQELIKSTILSKRVIQEKEIEEYKRGIDSIRDKRAVFGELVIPEDFSLKAFCPEVYKEYPDPVEYKKQFEAMSELFTKINECLSTYNKRALEKLNEIGGA